MAVKTTGMLNFERQLDKTFPHRVKPDGWIGDEAHHQRTSSHNPDDTPGSKPEWDGDSDNTPDVRGLDVSRGFGRGISGRMMCQHIVTRKNVKSVIRYLIHDGAIYHADNDFVPVIHTGDPHREHIHITFAFTEAADDNDNFNYEFDKLVEDDVTAEQNWGYDIDPTAKTYSAGGVLWTLFGRSAVLNTLPTQIRELQNMVDDLVRDDNVEFNALQGALTLINAKLDVLIAAHAKETPTENPSPTS